VYGGKPSDIEALANLPFPVEARTRWDVAVGTRPDEDIIQVEAKEIGAIYQQISTDPQIQRVGSNLIAALAFISGRRTTVRLQKYTDWASFSVISDGVSMQVKESTQTPLVSYDPTTHTVTYGAGFGAGGTFTNDHAAKVSFIVLYYKQVRSADALFPDLHRVLHFQ
jgi:hypothetical protein